MAGSSYEFESRKGKGLALDRDLVVYGNLMMEVISKFGTATLARIQ
jgi:hypothetical protein